jgi:hypothetical protein
MKKFVLLMLILGLTSAAQAGLIWLEIDGSQEYLGTAGETVTIDVMADETCYGVELIAVEGDASIATTVVDMGGTSTLPTAGAGMSVIFGGYLDNYQGVLFDSFSESSTAGVVAGTVLASFEYTISAAWDEATAYWVAPPVSGLQYEYMEGSFATAVDSYGNLNIEGTPTNVLITGVHIIPEPMTMTLLGLGSLIALRRRKK